MLNRFTLYHSDRNGKHCEAEERIFKDDMNTYFSYFSQSCICVYVCMNICIFHSRVSSEA